MVAKKKSKRSPIYKERVMVEVRPAPFRRADSLHYLDVTKLGRAKQAEFEYGHVIDGKAHRTVYASVRKGMVTGLRVEGCSDCLPMKATPDLDRLVRRAMKKLNPKGGRDSKPVAVATFLARQTGPVIERSHCWMICGFGRCIICCHCCSLNLFGWSCSIIGGDRSPRR